MQRRATGALRQQETSVHPGREIVGNHSLNSLHQYSIAGACADPLPNSRSLIQRSEQP